MGAAEFLGLHYLWIHELALHTVVRVWETEGVAGGVAVEATRGRLDLPCLWKCELQAAEVVCLV